MSRPPTTGDGARLPDGFTVRLARDTVVCGAGTTLLGGSTGKVVRLRPRALDLLDGASVLVRGAESAALARVLLDRGLADPVWPETPDGAAPGDLDADAAHDVTAVVPVRDRPLQLARLLAALPVELPVVVVDDGSRDPSSVAHVAARAGARLVVHPENRGPAAARNTGLAAAGTPVVVFVDSDVVPVPGWLATLRRHFTDPLAGVVAPRVRGLDPGSPSGSGGWVERYEAARSSLDLGAEPAAVAPHGRVSYLPSATLMVRVEAFPGFEERMRVAEDVDAIWRTCAAGWRVRYEPLAVVRHDHRTETAAWLRRKAFYGTGAALLAERHGSAVAPMMLTPWTAVLTVALLAQRWWSVPVAAASWAAAITRTARLLRPGAHPGRTAATITLIGAASTAQQTASAVTRHYWPVVLPLALVSRRARTAYAVAAVLDGLLDHRRTRPDLDPLRYVVARRLDDLAYGAGLWQGAVRARSARALLPRWRARRAVTQKKAQKSLQAPPTTSREGNPDGPQRMVRDGR